eukprot:scaffold5445_cov127-Isochrysis_galbana.AAC.3
MALTPARRLLLVAICSAVWCYYIYEDMPVETRMEIIDRFRSGMAGFAADPVGTVERFYAGMKVTPGGKYLAPTAALAVLSKLLANFFRRRIAREDAAMEAATAAAAAALASARSAGTNGGRSAKGRHKAGKAS